MAVNIQSMVVVLFSILGVFQLQAPAAIAAQVATVTVRNPIGVPRLSETVALQAAELRRLLRVENGRRVHIRDEQTGRDILMQAVDTNDDGIFEELVFQSDCGPKQSRKFLLRAGERQVPHPEDFKAYGRFVQERHEDFVGENDRIAHRMYAAALDHRNNSSG